MKTTRDTLLGGRVQIEQPVKGFRAGHDSILLAASLPDIEIGSALELGCGAGGALLPAVWRLSGASFVGLELDADMADLARRGVALNAFEDRCEILEGDAAARPADWEDRFDLVFSNPPFFAPGTASAPGDGKAGAYVESLTLDAWVKAMVFAARPKGWIILIHRAAELAGLMSALDRRAGEIAVLPIRPSAGAEAKRVLVRARKGLRPGPVRLLDGLELDDQAQIEAIMAGGALEWR